MKFKLEDKVRALDPIWIIEGKIVGFVEDSAIVDTGHSGNFKVELVSLELISEATTEE